MEVAAAPVPCASRATALTLSLVAGFLFVVFATAFLFWWLRRRHERQHGLPTTAAAAQLALVLGVLSAAVSATTAVTWHQYATGAVCL